jgi:FAD/FMN-containing dehydrogenase
MAEKNPTHGWRVVPLNLPAKQVLALIDDLRIWIAGLREELAEPERLRDPAHRRREMQAYERLLVGVVCGVVVVPDEEARAFLASAAKHSDEANDYEQLATEHDALYGLLSRLDEVAR